jgi:hypothetical protein
MWPPQRLLLFARSTSAGASPRKCSNYKPPSAARRWRDQGKHADARYLIGPIYGWFTEGFDALDLRDAKALLNDLI